MPNKIVRLCLNAMVILGMALSVGHAAMAAEPIESLNGPWVRVSDGCDALLPEVEENLPTSGGRSDLINRLNLFIDYSNYTAAMHQPRYCEKGIGPEYVKPENFAQSHCHGTATNTGKATFLFSMFERDANGIPTAEGTMVLKAEHWEGVNLWGHAFDNWQFRLYHGVLHLALPRFWGCSPKSFHAYFIRPPQG